MEERDKYNERLGSGLLFSQEEEEHKSLEFEEQEQAQSHQDLQNPLIDDDQVILETNEVNITEGEDIFKTFRDLPGVLMSMPFSVRKSQLVERSDKPASDNEVSTAIKPYEAHSNQQQDFHEVRLPRTNAIVEFSDNLFVQSDKNDFPFNASINSAFEPKAFVPAFEQKGVSAFESKDFQRLSHALVQEEDPSEIAPQSQSKSQRLEASKETPRDKQVTES